MNPSEYQKLAARTECDQQASRQRLFNACEDNPSRSLLPARLNHAVLGLTGEVGELAGAAEKWLYYGKDLDLLNLAEEVGDCLWYLALLCNAARLDFSKVMEANVEKLKQRFPDKYSDLRVGEDARDRSKEASAVSRVTGLDALSKVPAPLVVKTAAEVLAKYSPTHELDPNEKSLACRHCGKFLGDVPTNEVCPRSS